MLEPQHTIKPLDERLLQKATLVGVFVAILALLSNILSGAPIWGSIVIALGIVAFGWVYIQVRRKGSSLAIKNIFLVSALSCLAISWLGSDGMFGGVPYYLLYALLVFSFIYSEKQQKALLMGIGGLFFGLIALQWLLPDLVRPYGSMQDRVIDIAIAQGAVMVFITVTVIVFKNYFDLHKEALIEQKNYSEALLNAIPEMVSVFDDKGTFLEYKTGTESDLAMPPEAFLGRQLQEVMPPLLAEKMQEKIALVMQKATVQRLEYQLTVDEALLDFEARFSPFGNDKVIATVQNISERKKEEALLKRTSILLEDAQRLVKMGAWELDLKTGITYWTDGVYEIHGVDKSFDHNKANGIEFYHPDYRPVISKAITDAIEQHEPFDVECKFIDAGQRELWVRATGYPIIKEGKASHIIGMFQDITDQKLAEQAIIESEAKLQSVLNEVEDVIWSVRIPDFKTLLATPSVQNIYGYSVEEWMADSSIWQKAIHPEDQSRVNGILNDLETKGSFEAEYRIVTKQGQVKWIHNKAKIIADESQQPIRIDGAVADITRRKEAETQILKQQQDLVRVGQIAKVGGWEYDVLNERLSWSKITYDIHEMPYDFVPATETAAKFYKEGENREKITQAFTQAIQEGKPYDLELIIITAKSREIWVRAIGEPVFENGKCVKILGVFQDITEQKIAEEKILSAQRRLQNFFELNRDFMAIANTDGYFEVINPAFERELGYSEAELMSQKFLNLVHPDDVGSTLKEVAKLSEGALALDFENRYKKKDGTYIWLSWRATPDPQTGKIFSTARNITYEKKLEKLAALNMALKDRPHLADLAKTNYFDKVLKGLLDLSESKYGFLGEVFYENGEPYLKTYVLTNIAWNEPTRKFYEENAPQGLEFRNLNTLFGYALKHKTLVISNNPHEDSRRGGLPEGHPDLNAFMGIPILDEDDSLIGMIGIANKKGGYSEKNAAFLTPFIDSFANIIQKIQSERKRLEVEKELQRQNKKLVVSEEELTQSLKELKTTQRSLVEQKETLEKTLEELQDSQMKLVQSEKMASLGLLTAGVAHEINNPVNYISGGTQALLMIVHDLSEMLNAYVAWENAGSERNKDIISKHIAEIKGDIGEPRELAADALAMVNDINTGVERVTNIVKGLRDFSRPNENQLVSADIHELIDSTLLILHSKYRDRVTIEKKLNLKNPDINCYPSELSQVFMNIIGNAIDAIEDKGTITIATKDLENKVSISIKDTGQGMPESIRSKIFDPFFTTKGVGKGTGLGLYIVHGIIERHRGGIEIVSEEGKGTEFVIELSKH